MFLPVYFYFTKIFLHYQKILTLWKTHQVTYSNHLKFFDFQLILAVSCNFENFKKNLSSQILTIRVLLTQDILY